MERLLPPLTGVSIKPFFENNTRKYLLDTFIIDKKSPLSIGKALNNQILIKRGCLENNNQTATVQIIKDGSI